MPGKVKVKVLAGRNLPVMDRGSDTTDAFVEIKFGSVTHKTDVCRKSLNPHWNNSDWYRFEVDDSELQDEPLQLRLMDHDTYSANDAIGKVVVSLAPLLAREPTNTSHRPHHHSGTIMSGWIPVFDTMHGIRGELNIIVKVELFSDFNKFRQSSCGVQFFHCPMIPPGYQASVVHGFVEELTVNADPEYQWIDKIRTPRASNEARQVAFVKLSNQVQRRVGLKAAELGANAVVGYMQSFDLEGEAGVVARAVGTAVTIVRTFAPQPSLACSQHQLQKYIEFLTTDNDSYSNINQYFQSHQEQMYRMLSIMSPKYQSWSFSEDQDGMNDSICSLDQSGQVKRQMSIQSLFTPSSVHYTSSMKSLPVMPMEAMSLHNLLTQEDARLQHSSAIKRGLKNLNKKVTGLKSKRLHKQISDDQISLKSTASDTSRLSLSDVKSEFKKLKKVPIFRRSKSTKDCEGGGMASVLVRSVLHANSSLACIAETQDSLESPNLSLRQTIDDQPDYTCSEPNIIINTAEPDDDGMNVEDLPFLPLEVVRAESESNVVQEEHELKPHRTSESCPATPMASEKKFNLLTLPDTSSDIYGSDVSALSCDSSEPFSSSEDESENFGLDEDPPLSTVSAVVKSVLEQKPNPAFIAQMEEKLDYIAKHPSYEYEDTDNVDNVDYESYLLEDEKRDNKGTMKFMGIIETEQKQNEKRKAGVNVQQFSTQQMHSEGKFNIEPVNVKECSIKQSQNKGSVITDSMNLQKYSILQRQCEEKPSNEPVNMQEFCGKQRQHEEKVNTEPVNVQQFSTDKSQIKEKTSIQSINVQEFLTKQKLTDTKSNIESVNIEFPNAQKQRKEKPDAEPRISATKPIETSFVSKFHLFSKKGANSNSISLPSSPVERKGSFMKRQWFKFSHSPMVKSISQCSLIAHKHKGETKNLSNPTMSGTDLKSLSPSSHHSAGKLTVLGSPFMSYADLMSLHNPNTDDAHSAPIHIDENNSGNVKMYIGSEPVSRMSLSGRSSPRNLSFKRSTSFSPAGNRRHISPKDKNANIEPTSPTSVKSSGLVQTAMQTILMDRVQALVIPISDGKNPDEQFFSDVNTKLEEHQQELNNKAGNHSHISPKEKSPNIVPTSPTSVKSSGLVQTAMKTMLMDRVQALVSPISDGRNADEQFFSDINMKLEENQQELNNKAGNYRRISPKEKSPNIVSTSPTTVKSSGLVQTAMQTMLMDRVQALVIPISDGKNAEEQFFSDVNTKLEEHQQELNNKPGNHHHISPKEESASIVPTSPTSVKPSGLVQTAMQTMLMDRVQALVTPISEGKNADEQFFPDFNTILEEHQQELNSNRKLVRQDSIHSTSDERYVSIPCIDEDPDLPILEHIHKFGFLETIPSLPETSIDFVDPELEVEESFVLEPTNTLNDSAVDSNETKLETQTLDPDTVCHNSHAECSFESDRKEERSSPKHTRAESYGGKDGGTAAQAASSGNTTISPPSGGNVQTSTNATTIPVGMHRRSSDSDLSITPKGGSLTMASATGGAILRPSMNPNNLDMLDYPFLTMTEFPPGFIIHLGGAVNARSVKLIDGGSSEGNSRAAWWAELRTELRAHARALRCTAVLGYSESASICDDVCVMSVSGTAAVINLEPASFAQVTTANFNASNVSGTNSRILGRADSESESTNRREVPVLPEATEKETETNSETSNQQVPKPGCSLAHVPYNYQTMPYQANVDKCSLCKRSRVPKLLICSIELPQSLAITGRGCLISAAAARIRRAPPNGEPGARDISDQLPFLEYELHRLLIAKLRVHGMNAIFGVKTTIAAGERMVVALVTGTGVFISALPPPRAPALRGVGAGGESGNNETLVELQRALDDALAANRAVYELDSTSSALPSDDSDEDLPSLDLAGDKEACILEVDDAEDVEMARSLTEPRAPKGIHAVTTQSVPGLPVRAVGSGSGIPHTFTQLWRARLPQPNAGAATAVARHVHRLLQSVYYKLRRMTPCAVCNLKFQLVLPEVDEIQLLVTGVAISVSDSLPLSAAPVERNEVLLPRQEEASEMIFPLDEEDGGRDAGDKSSTALSKSTGDGKNLAGLVQNASRACGVALTPLALVEGARSQRPVSALRLLFVRETTSVRELGGLSGFLHTFITEVLAVVRAYTTALGGNALASFYITELMLQDNPHKNQGQCLLSVGGDVVQVTY